MAALYKFRNIQPLKKWVDNFIFFRFPRIAPEDGTPSYLFDLKEIYKLANALGWPWKHSKTHPFTFTFKYLGFL
jgi:hypothetical protein